MIAPTMMMPKMKRIDPTRAIVSRPIAIGTRPPHRQPVRNRVGFVVSEVVDANGFGWWSDDTVAANIETLGLLGREVMADLWDRSILEEVHG